MKNARSQLAAFSVTSFSLSMLLFTGSSLAQQIDNDRSIDPDKARVIAYWTKERKDAATPRDLLIDVRGLAYLRRADGALEPYGHTIAAEVAGAAPLAGSDTAPPSISNMDPGPGAVIGASHTFSAVVTDASGVRSVSFIVRYPDGVTTQTFQAQAGGTDTWSVTLQGFTDGNWRWHVQAKDNAKRGGNTAISAFVDFSVDTGGGSGGSTGGDTVSKAEWTGGGVVQNAAGRIYLEMPNNASRKGPWTAYVCSGTAATDNTTGRSVILTAAHCVYDDAHKAFARNVLFIPDQASTNGSGTDLNCSNDPIGCWVPSFGVVDIDWTTRTFPNNIAWDYAYYVVSDTGAHVGAATSSDSLETAAGTMAISFSTPYFNDTLPGADSIDFTHGLGYSYNEDPNLMYCAEDMTTNGAANWWLQSCGLGGGSSGGPWVQPMSPGGDGPVISVNSWGYTNSPGMAGPKLAGTSASCVFTMAKTVDWLAISDVDGDQGFKAVCP